MSKFIVVIFPDETKAYEGTRALKELHAEDSLTLYGMAVVTKDANGKLSVKQQADEGPVGTAVGAVVGGLIGLLGGPVGAVLGLGGGALLGSTYDLHNFGAGGDFIDKVSGELTPGKAAVVAEISEDWVTPLDTRMERIGGVVVRQGRADFEGERARQEAAARKAEMAHLKAEYAQAREEDKARLKARIHELQAKTEGSMNRIKDRIDQFQQEADAKLKTLEQQATKAKGDAKAKIEQRIAEVRADEERRAGQLKQALSLAKEALV